MRLELFRILDSQYGYNVIVPGYSCGCVQIYIHIWASCGENSTYFLFEKRATWPAGPISQMYMKIGGSDETRLAGFVAYNGLWGEFFFGKMVCSNRYHYEK